MSLRLITSLTLVTLSGCDLDHPAAAAAIAELEGECTHDMTKFCHGVRPFKRASLDISLGLQDGVWYIISL